MCECLTLSLSRCREALGWCFVGQVSNEGYHSANVGADAKDDGQDGQRKGLAGSRPCTRVVPLG